MVADFCSLIIIHSRERYGIIHHKSTNFVYQLLFICSLPLYHLKFEIESENEEYAYT